MTEHLLGIHCSYLDGQFLADGNCALASDGELVFAIAEERVSRIKYDGRFQAGLAYLLRRKGLQASDIAAIAVSTFGLENPPTASETDAVERVIRDALPGFRGEIRLMGSHHEAHAYSALALAGVTDALVAVIDNEGSLLAPRTSKVVGFNAVERTSYFLWRGNTLELVARDHAGPGHVGYGKAYSKLTRYLGFGNYHASGKTMGLAAFGDPARFGELTLFERCENPETRMRNSADGVQDVIDWFTQQECPLPEPRGDKPLRRIDADIAAWIQTELEQSVEHRMQGLCAQHKPVTAALAGGVALNSVMNAALRRNLPVSDVFVPPSPGDAGLSIGALAWLIHQRHGSLPDWTPQIALGGHYSNEEISDVLQAHNGIRWEACDDPAASAAEAIAAGAIIGWHQGASEFGPRSLGQRSILANPGSPWGHVTLNGAVKHREWFRPFAPAVTHEAISTYFDDPRGSPFMMQTSGVTRAGRTRIPAATHVDDSARLQSVSAQASPDFHRLLTHLGEATGTPVSLNTSFNDNGEPIVETPADSLASFLRMDWIDTLFVGNWRVRRS